ncbi:uncharacterized protein CFAP97D2-like [Diprion similis]|uniref:uncharacterized protein CFAP97D2-like n=1 Tax=Diprion similis TaxID=362088 RepID=UPI001EF757A0|nr:uncharacterized protein CFAP97D2-like [Diprion similis]
MQSTKTCHEFVTPCQRKTYEYHRARVKSATSVVDVIPPTVRPHIKFDAKKRQLEAERQARIVKDNFILLKKLQSIMRGNNKSKMQMK